MPYDPYGAAAFGLRWNYYVLCSLLRNNIVLLRLVLFLPDAIYLFIYLICNS